MSRYVRGRCLMKTFEALSCTISLRTGGQSISKAASILFAVHDTRDGSTRNVKEGLGDLVMSGRQGIDTRGAVSSGNISPPIFAYCNSLILELGMVWEPVLF